MCTAAADMLREWLLPQLQEDIPDIPTTLHELETWIREACTNIDQEILHNVSQEDEYRFDVVQATHGAHIELY
jgi:serine/threonine protein phosphatase PrpC